MLTLIGLVATVLAAASPEVADASAPAPAASAAPAPQPPMRTYLPDDENWHAFCGTVVRDPLDAPKCVPLGGDRNAYVTFGLQVRLKYEHFFNKDWNPTNNGYLLDRELLDADLHVDRLRTFVELEHADASNQHAPIDPTWRDQFAASSAYAAYDIGGATGAAAPPLEVRYGVQRLAYGSERMIDDRSGLNAIQPFVGARARLTLGNWQTDAFAVRPITTAPYGFDNLPDGGKSFTGVYATDRMGSSTLDLYGLIDQRRSQVYDRGTAPEERDTLGARYATASAHFDSDTEIDKQFGSFGAATIQSYALETNVGWRFGAARNAFRVGVGGGIAPGDHNPHSLLFTTFRAPYPTGLTFGIIEANGSENTAGFTPNFSYTYHRKVTLAVKDYFYYRQSLLDGVYSAPGFPLRYPAGSDAAPIGNLGYVSVVDTLDRHWTLYGAYARYLTGQFLRESPAAPGVPSLSTAYYNAWLVFRL